MTSSQLFNNYIAFDLLGPMLFSLVFSVLIKINSKNKLTSKRMLRLLVEIKVGNNQ